MEQDSRYRQQSQKDYLFSVLLGTDVPKLDMLLQKHPFMTKTNGIEEAFVMTRAQLKEKQRVEDDESAKEERMGMKPNSLEGSKERDKLIAGDVFRVTC